MLISAIAKDPNPNSRVRSTTDVYSPFRIPGIEVEAGQQTLLQMHDRGGLRLGWQNVNVVDRLLGIALPLAR
jgi:hypothetical protein